MISSKSSKVESIRQDLEVLTVSKRPKLKKKIHVEEETATNRFDRINDLEEAKVALTICGGEETAKLDCFSYERFLKKKSIISRRRNDSISAIYLPDDILEMCLMRLPLTTLLTARAVCKKWRHMTATKRFLRLRREHTFQTPWLFLFPSLKDCCVSDEIHGYDVSQDQWHKIIGSNGDGAANMLKGRYMYSVTSIHEEIYVVGGRSLERSNGVTASFKSNRGVVVFSPLTRLWRKIASLRHGRSLPIVSACEVSSRFSTLHCEKRHRRSKTVGESDVYEDPHRLSIRRSSNHNATTVTRSTTKKPDRFNHNNKEKQFVLVAVGGVGLYDEPLDSGEIYDSATNTWSEIQTLPSGFGVVRCGTVCDGIFYAYSENDKLSGYDIERGFWITIQTSPIPPRVHEFCPKLVSCNNRLFVVTVSWCDEGDGEIGRRNKAVRKLWELDLVYLTWTEVSVHPDAPMDWSATYVSDQDTVMGVEMFKIFGQGLGFFTLCDVTKEDLSWRHVSRNHRTHKLSNLSCMNKTVVLLHL
ncbi:unnamed protein product [Cochlearia groenlandica]